MNKWVNRKLDEKRSTGKGFTLIELLVVITVLGILAAIIVYAVGNITGAANTAANGTTSSEVTQAEAQYCQQNGKYGTVGELVNAGLLSNPNPNLKIYVSTIPANAQIYAACGTTTTGGSASGSVYDVFPQTITQPDGTHASIAAAPTNILTFQTGADEILAALGVTTAGGATYADEASPAFGALGLSPLVNLTNYANLGSNVQLYAAAKPQLIVGQYGGGTQYEAIAPVYSYESSSQPGLVGEPAPGSTYTQPLAGDPSILTWYNELVQLGTILNAQAQAAAFITDFENAAAAIIPSLQGHTVSIIIPITSGTSVSNVVVVGYGSDYSGLLEYLGMTVTGCPATLNVQCAQEVGGGANISIANFTQAYVPGQYLEIVEDVPGNFTTDAAALGSSPFSGLTQIAGTGTSGSNPNATPGCWLGGSAPGNTATAPCYVWGPTYNPSYFPPTNETIAPSLPAPLNSYCSILGVVQDSNGNLCPGALAPATPVAGAVYTPVTLTESVSQDDGPLAQLAAMLPPNTGPAASTPTILQDF